MARLSVSDTGPGIPKDTHDELFKPFSRLGAELSNIEGAGVGLILTKQLVELMGGVSASRARKERAAHSGSRVPGPRGNAARRPPRKPRERARASIPKRKNTAYFMLRTTRPAYT